MSTAPSIIWHRSSSSRWLSHCGRYAVQVSRWHTGALVFNVYFYGLRACPARHFYLQKADELPLLIRQWCEQHRLERLPKITHFETWAAQRYGNGEQLVCGPFFRRDQVRRWIDNAGDGELGLQWDTEPMTINQRYALLYQCTEPESSDASIREIA